MSKVITGALNFKLLTVPSTLSNICHIKIARVNGALVASGDRALLEHSLVYIKDNAYGESTIDQGVPYIGRPPKRLNQICALKLFFGFCANHPHHPHFGAKILLDFAPANGASEDD